MACGTAEPPLKICASFFGLRPRFLNSSNRPSHDGGDAPARLDASASIRSNSVGRRAGARQDQGTAGQGRDVG